MVDFKVLREEMMEFQLSTRGILDKNVLNAFMNVEREKFVGSENLERSYDDCPLPIGSGQTISQPYVVAFMLENLDLTVDDSVLEIGTGSGYQAAILSFLSRSVTSIEIVPELCEFARENLFSFSIKNVNLLCGDIEVLREKNLIFDKIIVSAASPLDRVEMWGEFLVEGGEMIVPVGKLHSQVICKYKKMSGKLEKISELIPVVFVPLRGEFGF